MSGAGLRGARVLVTGAAGFLGAQVIAGVRKEGAEAVSLDRTAPADHLGDLGDEPFLRRAVSQAQPTHIIHLAGVLPGAAGGAAAQYQENVLKTVLLLEAVCAAAPRALVLLAGSSAVYGESAPAGTPLSESAPLRPVGPYGVSKAAQELVAVSYQASRCVSVIRVRAFNLVGPGQRRGVAADVARQLAQGERGGVPVEVSVGNLASRRDYVDVRDAARAYALLAAQGVPGEAYNVCTGRAVSTQECVDILCRLAAVPACVRVDASRMRPGDIADQSGDPSRIAQAMGWRAEIPLEQSLQDVLESWRAAAAVSAAA